MSEGIGILAVQAPYPTLYQFTEGQNLRHRTLADIHWEEHGFLDNLPQTHAVSLRRLDNLSHRCVADTSGGIVDDTLKSLLIVGIRNQSEIGNHVLDFLTLVETQSAIVAIRDVFFSHLFLKTATLCIRAIENGKVTPVTVILPTYSLDVLADDHRLLLVRIGRLQL